MTSNHVRHIRERLQALTADVVELEAYLTEKRAEGRDPDAVRTRDFKGTYRGHLVDLE